MCKVANNEIHVQYVATVLAQHWIYYYIPSPNQQKIIRPTNEVINEVINDESYDVVAVNTASKCLTRMIGCWDLEFEPSVEEIVDYR